MALKTFQSSFQISTGIIGTIQNVPTLAAAGNKSKFIRFGWNGRVAVPPTNGIGNATHQFGMGVAVNAAVTYPNYSISTKSQNAVTPSNNSSDVFQTESIYTMLAGSNAVEGTAKVVAWNGDGSFDLEITAVFLTAITIHFKIFYGDDIYLMEQVVTTEPAAVGSVNMTFSRRPDFLLVLANASGAISGGIANDSRMCIGAASFNNGGIQQWTNAYGANDGAGTTQTASYNRFGEFISHLDINFGAALTGRANISAIVGRVVTLNWAVVSGGGNREHIVLAIYGGQWHCGEFDTTTAGNPIVEAGIPFSPTAGVDLHSDTKNQSAVNTPTATDERVLGGWDSSGNQRSLTIEDSNGVVGSTRISTAIQFDSIYASTNGAAGPAIDARITYTSTQANGFTLQQPTSDGAGRCVYYIAAGDTNPSTKTLIPWM
jgi:hypothetical protein